MSRYSLAALEDRFSEELDELLRIAALVGVGKAEAIPTAEYCIVHLQDAWTRFVGDLVLRSALGNATRSGGQPIAPGPLGPITQRDSLTWLRARWQEKGKKKPFYWNPNWFTTKDSDRAVDLLQPTNGQDLKTALGAAANPIEDIRVLRNFIAHRGESSAGKLYPLAQGWRPGWRQPADLVFHRPIPGVETRFEEWCRRLRLVAGAAVK